MIMVQKKDVLWYTVLLVLTEVIKKNAAKTRKFALIVTIGLPPGQNFQFETTGC